MSKILRFPMLHAAAGLIFILLGCQQVFTYAPFSSMADDPSTLSRDRLIKYGWDVIATGDTAKITKALNAVTAGVTANPSDKQLWYVGANLSLYLSKATTLFTDQPTDLPGIAAYKANVVVPMLEMAAVYFAVAATPPSSVVLNATDNVFTTIGLLLPTTADDFNQLMLLAPPLLAPQTAIFTNYYTPGIAALGGPGGAWDLAIRAIFFPLAP